MVNAWWLALEAVSLMAFCFWTNRTNYRCGIWDGAFNHFLPVVQREMLRYDSRRARQILDAEAEWVAAPRGRAWYGASSVVAVTMVLLLAFALPAHAADASAPVSSLNYWLTVLAPEISLLLAMLLAFLLALWSGLLTKAEAWLTAHHQAALAQAIASANAVIQPAIQTGANAIIEKVRTGQIDLSNRASIDAAAVAEVALVKARVPDMLAVAQPVEGALIASMVGKVQAGVAAMGAPDPANDVTGTIAQAAKVITDAQAAIARVAPIASPVAAPGAGVHHHRSLKETTMRTILALAILAPLAACGITAPVTTSTATRDLATAQQVVDEGILVCKVGPIVAEMLTPSGAAILAKGATKAAVDQTCGLVNGAAVALSSVSVQPAGIVVTLPPSVTIPTRT